MLSRFNNYKYAHRSFLRNKEVKQESFQAYFAEDVHQRESDCNLRLIDKAEIALFYLFFYLIYHLASIMLLFIIIIVVVIFIIIIISLYHFNYLIFWSLINLC